jgi:hypothetical protein
LVLPSFQKFGGFPGGDFTALEAFEDVAATGELSVSGVVCVIGARRFLPEKFIHKVETLADSGIGDAQFLFDFADVSTASKENEDESLKLGRKAREGGQGELGFDAGAAGLARETTDDQVARADWASGDDVIVAQRKLRSSFELNNSIYRFNYQMCQSNSFLIRFSEVPIMSPVPGGLSGKD